MSRRTHKPVLALALALSGLALLTGAARAGEADSARPASAALLGGVNTAGLGSRSTPADADRTIALAHDLHAKVIREELPWSALEPNARGRLDPKALAYTDRLMRDAAADGIGIIVLVDSTPCWATSAPQALRSKCVPGRDSSANGWPPARPDDYAAIVRYLAQRYGTTITALEVWNEPDQANERYFAGPHKPERYAAILRAVYSAIKQANPQVAVLGGSLVGPNGVFLRALYAAGIKGYYDGLAVHFYTLTLASVRAIHEVQLANGDAKPLWLDEFGWSSCWPRQRRQQEQACVTARVQAANLADVFQSLTQAPYVAAAASFKLQDSRGENFGALTVSGARKPAFAAIRRVLGSGASPGIVHPVTMSLRRLNGRVRATGSGPVGDFMRLEAFRGGLLRYRAVFTLNRFNRYSIDLPRVLGTHGLRVRVYQYWTGPGHATQKAI